MCWRRWRVRNTCGGWRPRNTLTSSRLAKFIRRHCRPFEAPASPHCRQRLCRSPTRGRFEGAQAYFETTLRPKLRHARQVLVLAQRATDADGSYTENLVAWCRTLYGDGMTVEVPPSGRGIDLRVIRAAHAIR